jgi:hypothetical protein
MYTKHFVITLVALLGWWTVAASAQDPAAVQEGAPKQISVSVKIIEFQTEKGIETGLSAYFKNRNQERTYGKVSSGISAADLTFPASTDLGLSVFLDRIAMNEGDIEILLQALVRENRANIFSKPKAMVMVSDPVGTTIGTTVQIPYEQTAVVGSTAVQATEFQDTGVGMTIKAPHVIDDDGDWRTTNDTYIMLDVDMKVTEEGGRFTVALDDNGRQIDAPEFVDRSIKTKVWVRHGQILILGGLFRSAVTRSLDTVPWLTRAEDMAVGLAERLVPGNFLASPISSTIGNRAVGEGRRELVFIIKAESWRPAFVIRDEHGFDDAAEEEEAVTPTDVIQDVLEDISEIPAGIAEGITGVEGGDAVDDELGSGK